MHINLQLHAPRYTFVASDEGLRPRTWFEGLISDEGLLQVKDPEGTVNINGCIVFFERTSPTTAKSEFRYSASWRDPSDEKLYEGTCRLHLNVTDEILRFLDSFYQRDMELHIRVEIDANRPVVNQFHDDIEWDPEQQNPLPAKIVDMGFVPRQAQ